LEVQLLLADVGKHLGASIPDQPIAATAEFAGLTVLHGDKDFELISELTGQRRSASPSHRTPPRPPERSFGLWSC
jgi:predicted nucleic acid-binding protein